MISFVLDDKLRLSNLSLKQVHRKSLNKQDECELMLTYDTPAYMFNVYKNQPSRQTGSRNLMGPKTLTMTWGTYMKLVTKYQISAINICWEKCDEKWAYMGPKNASHNMAYLYEACDQISDSCHQYLLRKMRRKMCIYVKCV